MTPTTTTTTMATSPASPDAALKVAEAQMELAVRLADLDARRPRWTGKLALNAPATSAFFLISAPSVGWVQAAAAHPRVGAVDASIEGMGVFAAIEASKATGRPQVVVGGAGPGTLGLLWAIPGARSQGASLLVLVPRTPPGRVGCVDVQEASRDQPLHTAGAAVCDEVIAMEHPDEMPRIAMRLRHLFARPQGVVVMLSVPTNLLNEPCPPLPDVSAVQLALPAPSAATIARVAEQLAGPGGPPAFLLGSGCVPYREELRTLLKRWGAVHFTSPAATGLLPGSLGVIGNAAWDDVPRRLRELDVRCVVVLGSRLGTASGGGDAALFPAGCSVVEVEVDAGVTAANAVAMWNRPVLSVRADIGAFVDALGAVTP